MSRGDRSSTGRERSPEERERDRQARARRRAGLGEPESAVMPPTPVPEPPTPGPEPPTPVSEPYAPVPEAYAPVPPPPPKPRTSLPQPPPPVPDPYLVPPPAEVGPYPPPRAGRSGMARGAAVVGLSLAALAIALAVRAVVHSRHTTTVHAPAVSRLLIPEGKTRAQIAQIASQGGLTGSYRGASKRSALLNPAHYGAPRGTPDLEGFLFPATYDVTHGEPAARLVRAQLVAFRENFGAAAFRRARALHVTPYGLLTIASMVEREAKVHGDRAKIAAVIYNRLRQGIPLGIDATIYYALEQQTGIATYKRELTEAELHMDSPYNTRTRKGLPPTPISNPGEASIHAAAHPAHVPYLYYVSSPDGCGKELFSTSLAAFEANAAAYHAAVRGNGGRPPTCKSTP